MQFEALHDLKSIKVPDDDVCLQLQMVVRVSRIDLNFGRCLAAFILITVLGDQ